MELAGLWASTMRVPEPASIETPALVRSFEAMARFHSFLDRAFVRRVQLVCSPVGRLLDVGTGPGLVPILLRPPWSRSWGRGSPEGGNGWALLRSV